MSYLHVIFFVDRVVITVSQDGMLNALQQMHGTSLDGGHNGMNRQGAPNVAALQAAFADGTQHTDWNTAAQSHTAVATTPSGAFAVPSFGTLAGHSFGAGAPAFDRPGLDPSHIPEEERETSME